MLLNYYLQELYSKSYHLQGCGSCYKSLLVTENCDNASTIICNFLFDHKQYILNLNRDISYVKWFKNIDKFMAGISIGGTVVAITVRFIKSFESCIEILEWTTRITSFYGILKSGYFLYDKTRQKKSINPFKSNESLFHWMDFGSSIFAATSTAGCTYLQHAAAAGKHVHRLISLTINVSIFGTILINGYNLTFNVLKTFKNYIKNKTISTSDLLHLAISSVFFSHSLLQSQKANSIIENAQKAKLSQIRLELENDNQKINFDREILLDQNKANLGGHSKIEGTRKTIEKLNSFLKLPKWRENFGKAVHPESSAAIHACQPTHLTENGADIILRENAISKARYSHRTRYDGNRINQKSTNTILAIPPHHLDIKISQEALKQNIPKGQISLPGKYYGYEIKLGPEGIFKSDKIILAENPQFYFNGESATHYFSKGGTIQYLENLPKNIMQIYVNLRHEKFKGLFFVNLFNRRKVVFCIENVEAEID